MNYLKHYDILIDRAKHRQIDGYVEYHHVIPRCIGGTDEKSNLVALTPEEHYVAHQLLVKIYPENSSLVLAATMMIPSRPSNKLYGWIRKKLSGAMSISQSGTNNSQYGKYWIHNMELKISKRIDKDTQIEKGWQIGRVINFDKEVGRSLDEYRMDRNDEAKKLAYELYESFLNSDYTSVTSFAKYKETSQPRLTQLWEKYVPEYNQRKQHGKPFKK